MDYQDIIGLRLQNQRLIGNKFREPEEVVQHLGAVQAQDFNAAKWSLGHRLLKPSNTDIEKAYNEGKIVRTHVMRPTWHFVHPEDIIWMQKLTSPNVKRLMGYYNRKLELNDNLFKKTKSILIKLLKNKNYSTRKEIKYQLEQKNIKTDVQRLAHIVSWAELDGIICSGPIKGKQFSYALVPDRIPKPIKLNREESLARLATKYFLSHGPAQLKDFSWWSGLSMNDSREAISMIKSKLSLEICNNKEYWIAKELTQTTNIQPDSADRQPTTCFLLSIYDEYTIAYKDRSDLNSYHKDIEKMISMGNALTSVIIVNGKVSGTWRRIIKKGAVHLTLNFLKKINRGENEKIQKEIKNYSDFLDMPIVID